MNKILRINNILALIFSFSLCAHETEKLFYQQFKTVFLETSSDIDIQTCKKLMEDLTELLKISDDKYVLLTSFILSLPQMNEQHLYLQSYYKKFNQEKSFNTVEVFNEILDRFIIFENGNSELYKALKPYLSLKTRNEKTFIENLFSKIYVGRIKNLDNFISFYSEVVKNRRLSKKLAYSVLNSFILNLDDSNNQLLFFKLIESLFLSKKYDLLLQATKEMSVNYKFHSMNNMNYFLNNKQIIYVYEYCFNSLQAKDSISEKEAKFIDDLSNLLFDQFGSVFGNHKTVYVERVVNFHDKFNNSLALIKSDKKRDIKIGFTSIKKQLEELSRDNFFLDKFYIKILYRVFVGTLKENNLEEYYQKIFQKREKKLRKSWRGYEVKLKNCPFGKRSETEKYYYEKWKDFLDIFSPSCYLYSLLRDQQIDYFFKTDILCLVVLLKDLLLLTKLENSLLRDDFDCIYRLLVEKYSALSEQEKQHYDLKQFKEIYKEVTGKTLIID